MATYYKEIHDLLDALCKQLAPNNSKAALQYATRFISNFNFRCESIDESQILTKASNILQRKSVDNIPDVLALFNPVLACDNKKKAALSFLIAMAENDTHSDFRLRPSSLTFGSYSTPLHYSPSQHSSTYKSVSSKSVKELYSRGPNKPSSIPSSTSRESVRFSSNRIAQVEHANKIISNAFNAAEDFIQDAIYSFTGIQGKYLRKDITTGGFRLDPKARNINKVNAGILLRLSDLGYYHDQIQSFTDKKSGKCPFGLLGQGLISALNRELTQYYGMVALLKEQLDRQRQFESEPSEKLTLQKIVSWAAEPLERLHWLATIAETCQGKKGGELASSIYNFMANGNMLVRSIVKELLSAVCIPFQAMLSKWLLDGEIEDPHSEFFIEILPDAGADRLWHDKYRLKEGALPNFIKKSLANKILVTGKSINYLREVCQDNSSIKGRDELKQCLLSNVEHLFSPVSDTKLHLMIDSAYLNTSKKVLDIIMGPHKLLEHLQAMRRYLLLGQGDFINLLMENLKHELDRPAKDLYRHNLSSILDAAVRATNAQFDDPEILNHLDVRLMDSYEGDTGWDIFELQYTVRGPLSPILEPSMSRYKVIFKPLWRTKLIEFILSSKIWKEQKCNGKYLRSLEPELKPITHRLNLYTSEMIHFIHQMQYYILFEVLECSWADFLKQIHNAKALDDILDAHNNFLKAVCLGIFLDEKSDFGSLKVYLERVYNTIMKLESWQDHFYTACYAELDARRLYEKNIVESEKKKTYGVTAEQALNRKNEARLFQLTLETCSKNLNTIGNDYEYAVTKFLLMLASTNDNKLQLFGTRLDFNEHYKKRDKRLGQPLKFEHMRMSSIYFANKSVSSTNSSKIFN